MAVKIQRNMRSLDCVVTYLSFAIVVLFLCNCSKPESNTEPPKMWGKLESGKFTVGFRTMFLYDVSRPAIPYSDWDGKLYINHETKGRQMQINIWYPSKVAGQNNRLHFEHYVNLFGQQTDFRALDENKKEFASRQIVKRINAIGGNGSFSTASLDSLNKLKTNAYLDAEAVEGKFPLVVFPNGSSPVFQSIMCEYLTSHGFIVAAVGLKGENAYTEEASFKGLEIAVMDLNFAIQNLLKIPQLDKDRIGLIGNAITSSQLIAYQTRNLNIDCVISLEGGLLSSFEQNILNKTAFYDIGAVQVPILAIYAPHSAINPAYIFDLKYADKYFFRFPQMTEFHFLNFGQFEQFIPNIIGAHEGDVQRGHELACLYSLKFLETFLSNNLKSSEFLVQDLSDDFEKHIDTSFVKEAIAVPPDITSIKNIYYSSGFHYIDSLYNEHKKIDSTPFGETFYVDMKDWLAWKKDPEFRDRYQLYKLAYDSYPNSAEVNYYLSYFSMQTNHNEEAIFHVRKALKILEGNGNPDLTIDRAEKLESSLKQFLSRLRES